MQNVLVFSGDTLLCCAGLDYVADIVGVSEDGTQVLFSSSQSGFYDHFCITVDSGEVKLVLKTHMQYSAYGKTRALVCTNSCAMVVDNTAQVYTKSFAEDKATS